MLFTSFSAVAALALAAQATAAELKPYKPQLMKMSVHQMFGIGRRQASGYQPTQSQCGTGATCAEACGAGYETCTSSDNAVHCFNPAAAETCCPDSTGNSCDTGYYCTGDNKGETWCCPNGMDLVACAAAYSVSGALTSEIAKPTSTSTTSSSTTTSFTTTSAAASSASYHANTTTTCTSTLAATSSLAVANSTVAVATLTPTAGPTSVPKNAGNLVAPASALALLVAAGLAALL